MSVKFCLKQKSTYWAQTFHETIESLFDTVPGCTTDTSNLGSTVTTI